MNFKSIPGFPNYKFNPDTLEVKSTCYKEKILKPSKNNCGYYIFVFYNNGKGRTLKRSQISWLVNKGSLPPKHLQIDHIDADKTNDKFENLQILTIRENVAKAYQQNGKTLPTGVYWHIRDKKFVASITLNGKQKHLGSFDSPELALNEYKIAESILRE